MKKTIFLLTLITVGVTCMAAPMTKAQSEDALTKINMATAALKTMSCNFVQTKHLSMLSEKMVSKGTMRYEQPNKLRWEYTSPYKYLFIFNGTKVYVGNKSHKDVIDTNRNKVFKEVARLMMSTVTGTALSNSKDFAATISEKQSQWIVTLEPRKKEIKKMFKKITLTFSKSPEMISEVDIYEMNNDITNIKLTDITVNKPINETYFAIPK